MSTSQPRTEAAPRGPEKRRTAAAERRREREARIIATTRELFDARGVRDAQIEDVANAVGVNRAIIYRHFTGKEELFALTLVDYLKQLQQRLAEVDDETMGPEERLRRITEAFIDYGVEYPAFVDCSMTLMRMGPALLDELSESALFRLGRGITDSLSRVVSVIQNGVDQGVFHTDDVPLLANTLYAAGLGGLQIARLGVIVHERSPGIPAVAPISVDHVKAHLVASSLAMVYGRPAD